MTALSYALSNCQKMKLTDAEVDAAVFEHNNLKSVIATHRDGEEYQARLIRNLQADNAAVHTSNARLLLALLLWAVYAYLPPLEANPIRMVASLLVIGVMAVCEIPAVMQKG